MCWYDSDLEAGARDPTRMAKYSMRQRLNYVPAGRFEIPYQHHPLRRPYNTIINPTKYNCTYVIYVVMPHIQSDPTSIRIGSFHKCTVSWSYPEYSNFILDVRSNLKSIYCIKFMKYWG